MLPVIGQLAADSVHGASRAFKVIQVDLMPGFFNKNGWFDGFYDGFFNLGRLYRPECP